MCKNEHLVRSLLPPPLTLTLATLTGHPNENTGILAMSSEKRMDGMHSKAEMNDILTNLNQTQLQQFMGKQMNKLGMRSDGLLDIWITATIPTQVQTPMTA